MSYLHRMLTCPRCGKRVQFRDTVSKDGTCRDCYETPRCDQCGFPLADGGHALCDVEQAPRKVGAA